MRMWKAGVISCAEQIGWHFDDPQVLSPVRGREVRLRPGEGDVVERHAHGPGRLGEGVAALFQIDPHGGVALVHPCGEARDARLPVGGLDRLDGVGPLDGVEVAFEERVVEDGMLGLVGEDRDGDAGHAHDFSRGCLPGVLLPRGDEGGGPAAVELDLGDNAHPDISSLQLASLPIGHRWSPAATSSVTRLDRSAHGRLTVHARRDRPAVLVRAFGASSSGTTSCAVSPSR